MIPIRAIQGDFARKKSLFHSRLLAVPLWIVERASKYAIVSESNASRGGAGEEVEEFPLGSFARSSLAKLVFVFRSTD